MPWLGVALTYVSPAGRRSPTLAPLAAFGPRFVSVSVYVTVQVVDAFGASVPSGHDTGPAVGSDTVM